MGTGVQHLEETFYVVNNEAEGLKSSGRVIVWSNGTKSKGRENARAREGIVMVINEHYDKGSMRHCQNVFDETIDVQCVV